MTITTKLIGTIVLGAALMAPIAQAQSPDDRAGLRGPGAFEQSVAAGHPDNRGDARGPGAIATKPVTLVRPDDRGGSRGPGLYGTGKSVSGHPDNRDGVRGPGGVATSAVVQPVSDGFDWGDALIGGIGGVGAALLLTGCLFLLASQRNRARFA